MSSIKTQRFDTPNLLMIFCCLTKKVDQVPIVVRSNEKLHKYSIGFNKNITGEEKVTNGTSNL